MGVKAQDTTAAKRPNRIRYTTGPGVSSLAGKGTPLPRSGLVVLVVFRFTPLPAPDMFSAWDFRIVTHGNYSWYPLERYGGFVAGII